jgi:hypothetical protein
MERKVAFRAILAATRWSAGLPEPKKLEINADDVGQ